MFLLCFVIFVCSSVCLLLLFIYLFISAGIWIPQSASVSGCDDDGDPMIVTRVVAGVGEG